MKKIFPNKYFERGKGIIGYMPMDNFVGFTELQQKITTISDGYFFGSARIYKTRWQVEESTGLLVSK